MLSRVCSAAVNGIDAYPVEVEVNAGWGDTLVVIVGLPDAAVKESRDRVSTALSNSGFKFPMGRTTINLAPADVKKEGPSFDLPIALGMLAASEQLATDQLDNFIVVGELALTGAVRPCKGVLQIALRAKAEGKTGVIVPAANAAEAAVVEGLQVIAVQNLREAAQFLEGEIRITPTKVDVAKLFDQPLDDDVDFADVKGQESVKRALEIAAAGSHCVLLMGEPGTGNSVCARIHSSQFSAHISRVCSYYSVMRTISRLESSWLQRESTGRRDSAHPAPQAIQRYRNQYQTDADRCGPIDAYTHGFNFWMCQKGPKTGPSGAIPTLQSELLTIRWERALPAPLPLRTVRRMARQLRVENPGANCLGLNRGVRREENCSGC